MEGRHDETALAGDAVELAVRTEDGDEGLRIVLGGELDLAGRDTLLQRVAALPLEGRPVTLDLSRLAFMDSTGCRAVLEVGASMRERGAASYVVVAARSGPIERLLELTGLAEAIPIRWTEAP